MDALRYWIAASYLPDLGPRAIFSLLDILGDIREFFSLTASDYQAIGLKQHQIYALLKPNWRQVEADLAWRETAPYQHILCYASPDYPAQLKTIADPPLILYIKGDATLLQQSQLAMVGSRHPSRAGIYLAKEFASALVAANFVVTSGLALGVDAASHEGALSAFGKTIAVFGTGLSHIYPKQNRQLAERIIDGQGALVSEFPLASAPRPMHFPRRNRIISGLSVGVLVVEAAIKSGSLVTARHALSEGREVFAIPGSIQEPFSKGCHFLIKQGATLVESVADILGGLGWGEHRQSSMSLKNGLAKTKKEGIVDEKHIIFENKSELPLDLLDKEHHILSLITSEWIPFDQILLLSGLTMGELSSMLLSLELRGLIESVAGGYQRIVSV